MLTRTTSLVDELYKVPEKAEIINGEIIRLMATGRMPSYAAFELAVSLRSYIKQAILPGIVVPDNAGFLVNLPNRSSFSPDAAYYIGPNSGMRFFEGAPAFAVEVRSENDYGVTAEAEMAAKRRDYFAAGSLVVWDVDLLSETEIVRKYTAEGGTDRPAATFQRGETADAEPAVPGWRMPVNDLFEE
jgi:Uma2 family endonuclease